MVKHIVMWKMKDEKKEDNLLEMKTRLLSLVGRVKVIQDLDVGINFGESPAAFDIVLTTKFDRREDLMTYLKDPYHVEVANFVSSVTKERAVVDYDC